MTDLSPIRPGTVATPLLRLISDNPAIAMALPDRGLRDMADELLARRALDIIDARAERERRRADAIADALRFNFALTGNPGDIWRISTVAAVLVDHLSAHGWPDITHRHVYDTLAAICASPRMPLALGDELGHPVLYGLRAVGAPT